MIKILPITERINKRLAYQKWLQSLKVGDLILQQKFHPISKLVLDYQYEYWFYQPLEVAKIIPDKNHIVCTGNLFDCSNFSTFYLNGMEVMLDEKTIIKNPFAVRLVPCNISPVTNIEYYNHPIYEPDYKGDRFVLFQDSSHQDASYKKLKALFPTYRYRVNNGRLIHTYPGYYQTQEFESYLLSNNIKGLEVLYSESLFN